MTNVNYRNVLPSNLRYGNKNVMPLIPQNLDNNFNDNDKAMLRHLLENTSYTLAQSKQKNTEMTNLAYGILCEDEAAYWARIERANQPPDKATEKQQTRRNNVQKRIFMKEYERKPIDCRSTP